MPQSSRLRTLWPWAASLLALWAYGCERETNGMLRGTVTTLTHQRDAWERAAKTQRVVFQRDTVRLTKVVREYHAYVDSLRVHDTITVREQVIIAAADTALRACTNVVGSCAKSLALADSIHAVDQRLIRAYRKAQPGVVRRWASHLAWGAVGYTVGHLTR